MTSQIWTSSKKINSHTLHIMSQSAFQRLYEESSEDFMKNFPYDAIDELDEQGNTLLMRSLKNIILFAQVGDSIMNDVAINMTAMENEHGPFDELTKQMLAEFPTIVSHDKLCDQELERMMKITCLLIEKTTNFTATNKKGESALLLAILLDRWIVKTWMGEINDYTEVFIYFIEKKMNRKPSTRNLEDMEKIVENFKIEF